MRNVVVIYDFGFVNGGQAKVAISSTIALAEAGLNVTYFSAVGPVDPSLTAAGVKSVCVGQSDILADENRFRAVTSGIWNRTAVRELALLLEGFDPETTVLHTHGFAKALSPSIGPLITNGKFAHVYTMHEYFLACPNGGFYDFKKNEICTRKALSPQCLSTNCDPRNFKHKAWRVVRQAALWSVGNMPRNLRHVVFISETQKRAMAAYLDSATTLHYLPNPISVEKRPRVNAEENDVFLFIGRLSPEKGGLMFAKAAKRANVKAVFVGDGPEKEAILNANPAAIVTGWVSSNEVEDWLQRSRCLVFCSLWYETFGLVAYEAMACGIPAMCGRWNAAAEAITHEQTGLLYDDAAEDAIYNALRRMGHDPFVRELSMSAFDEYWQAPLDMSAHMDKLLGIYGSVLDEHAKPE